MSNGENGPPEAPGSSAETAKNVVIGAVVGAGAVGLAVATAPFWAPVAVVGTLVAGVAAVGVPLATALGGLAGWAMGGKK